MSDRRSSGQRRHEKVLARRKRRGRRGAACGGSGRVAPDAAGAAVTDAPVAVPPPREPDGLDALLDADGPAGVSLLIDEALIATVARTLAEGSARPGEIVGTRCRELDDEYMDNVDPDEHCRCCDYYVGPDDGPAGWARMRLVRWLLTARDRHGGGTALTNEVVAWVATRLDRHGVAVQNRAWYLGGPRVPAPEAPTDWSAIMRDVLETDDVAVLVWLVSGLVAVAGDGDVTWLRRLDRARRP